MLHISSGHGSPCVLDSWLLYALARNSSGNIIPGATTGWGFAPCPAGRSRSSTHLSGWRVNQELRPSVSPVGDLSPLLLLVDLGSAKTESQTLGGYFTQGLPFR